jgi:hypothetical protein
MPKNKQKSTGRQSKPKTLLQLSKKLAKTTKFWKKKMGWKEDITKHDAKSIILVAQVYPRCLTAMVLAHLLRVNEPDPKSTSLVLARRILLESQEQVLEPILSDNVESDFRSTTRLGLAMSYLNRKGFGGV